MPGILEGIRVVEWAEIHQAPGAAALLADLGADVIKIERRDEGDRARGMQASQGLPVASPHGYNYYFEGYNRHKRSLTLDVQRERGREIVYELVARSDVFLTSYRQPAVVNLGMDYVTLRQHNPLLVYCRATGFGPRGPHADDRAFDVIAQARSGFMRAGWLPLEEPNCIGGTADQMGEVCAAYGIVAALLARERWGIGQEVDTSILGGIILLQRPRVQVSLFTGREPPRLGRTKPRNPLDNGYKAGDAQWLWLGISMTTDRYWATFCRVVDRTDLIDDARFIDWSQRMQNAEALVSILDAVFATRPRDEWLALLRDNDLPSGPVNETLDLLNDPQVIANGYVVDYEHPTMGSVKLMGSPIHFSETPAETRAPAPTLGQHTEEILLELGHGWPEIGRLRDEGII